MTYLLTSTRKGISSIQLAKQVGVTQKTAWYMAHRLREIASNNTNIFSGIIEIDETYIGGKEKNKHQNKKVENTQGRSIKTKAPILGMISREDNKQVRAYSVENVKSTVINNYVNNNVNKNTTIYTDEFRNYNQLSKQYKHSRVNHKNKEYVRNEVHTNNIENFWSIFKRGYVGIYHWMSRKHLQRYINEFCFRYNYKDNYLINLLDKGMNKTLTYKGLING